MTPHKPRCEDFRPTSTKQVSPGGPGLARPISNSCIRQNVICGASMNLPRPPAIGEHGDDLETGERKIDLSLALLPNAKPRGV